MKVTPSEKGVGLIRVGVAKMIFVLFLSRGVWMDAWGCSRIESSASDRIIYKEGKIFFLFFLKVGRFLSLCGLPSFKGN